jgi:hypoxanthine phosphoribosyltransferase
MISWSIWQAVAAGERYLFVDDINDSGKTIARFRKILIDNGAVRENFRFAVLIGNVSSREVTEYVAMSLDRRLDKRWFIFPWGAALAERLKNAMLVRIQIVLVSERDDPVPFPM